MIRILVVDDQSLLRTAFRTLIDAEPDLEVVGEAGDGAEAVALSGSLAPDVVLMDIRMPGLDGLEATRLITRSGPDAPRVLILTTFDLDEHVFSALRGGASGFALKSGDLDELLTAIRIVAAGEALLAPSITRRLIEHFAASPEAAPAPEAPSAALSSLTEREHDVLRLVAAGLTNAEISGRLHVSVATAKTHVSRILTKLNARDRIQLVIIAYRSGLAVTD